MRFRLEVAGRPVEIRGRIDRVELDADGRVWVVDFKTTKTPRTQDRVDNDPQLAVYQMAVRAGALGELPGAADPRRAGRRRARLSPRRRRPRRGRSQDHQTGRARPARHAPGRGRARDRGATGRRRALPRRRRTAVPVLHVQALVPGRPVRPAGGLMTAPPLVTSRADHAG